METIEDIVREMRERAAEIRSNGLNDEFSANVETLFEMDADRIEEAYNASKHNAMADLNTLMLKDEKVRLLVALAEDYKRKAEKLQAALEGALGRCVTCDKDCAGCGALYTWVPSAKEALKEVR